MKADLVVIHPDASRTSYQGLAPELAAVETPLWAGMIAQYCRGKGASVALIDQEAERLSPLHAAARVAASSPKLVAIVVYGHQPSGSTQTMPAARELAKAIRATVPHAKIVLVGGHAAALPVRTLEEEPVDYVCTGEGPVTVWELLNDPKAARGVAERGGDIDALFEGVPAPLVENLDEEMPTPTFDLMPMGLYRAHNWHALGMESRAPYASLYTTLGCPYDCSFCCIQAPFRSGEAIRKKKGKSYRKWSAETVVRNLHTLHSRYGVRNVKIADEMFVYDREHVEGICDLLIAEGMTDMNLWAYGRVDTLKPALLSKMRQAGFKWLALGIESGSPSIRKGALKSFTDSRIYSAIDACKTAGIHVIANYIVGLPGETRVSMQDTFSLAKELNTEFANFYCAMAYPGSALYESANANDLPTTWSGYAQHSPDARPLRTPELSAAEILAFRDDAFRSYHSSGPYLSMIQDKFGTDGVTAIGKMLASRPLERTAR